jgi:hypothetical protein
MAERLNAAPRIVVLSGHPTDTEVAAIAAALERHRAAVAAERRTTPRAASPWVRAARLEGRGHAPIADRVEVTR